ncbi:MAG: hypothetical protein V2A74_01225, partial [bacterium]
MKHVPIELISRAVVVFVAALMTVAAFAQRGEVVRKDAKGTLFVVAFDPSQMQEGGAALKGALVSSFSAQGAGQKVLVFDTLEPAALAERILALSSEDMNNLGGVVEIRLGKSEGATPRALIEVYHYPLPEITRHHIESPVYSFKFGSDSALLAIRLSEELSKVSGETAESSQDVELALAADANRFLPRDVLRKTVRLSLPRVEATALAQKVQAAAAAYCSDEGRYAMGVLSDKVRRHASPENVEIRVSKFVYPNKERTEEERALRTEMSQSASAIKPFSSGLYYIGGLDRLSPYTYNVIDTSKQEQDTWREIESGSFVTSSVSGIVRTIPEVFQNYVPLQSSYREAK